MINRYDDPYWSSWSILPLWMRHLLTSLSLLTTPLITFAESLDHVIIHCSEHLWSADHPHPLISLILPITFISYYSDHLIRSSFWSIQSSLWLPPLLSHLRPLLWPWPSHSHWNRLSFCWSLFISYHSDHLIILSFRWSIRSLWLSRLIISDHLIRLSFCWSLRSFFSPAHGHRRLPSSPPLHPHPFLHHSHRHCPVHAGMARRNGSGDQQLRRRRMRSLVGCKGPGSGTSSNYDFCEFYNFMALKKWNFRF